MKKIFVLLSILFLVQCGTLKTVAKPNETGAFKDDRDGMTYKWVKIGNQIWMAENLNYGVEPGSYYYNNDKNNRYLYGLLYDYKVLNEVCPKGWHIPSEAEWEALEINVGMYSYEAKSKGIWRGTIAENFLPGGSSGFNVKFGGIHRQGYFSDLGEQANFWTSTRIDNPIYTRIFKKGENRIARNSIGTAYAISVRCVKDNNTF